VKLSAEQVEEISRLSGEARSVRESAGDWDPSELGAAERRKLTTAVAVAVASSIIHNDYIPRRRGARSYARRSLPGDP